MEHVVIYIRGVDTLLFRDGRPFDTSGGGRAESLFPPYPSTIAGYIRTQIGPKRGGDWTGISDRVQVGGPIVCRNRQAVFAAPADAVVVNSGGRVLATRMEPSARTEDLGTNLPGGMRPLSINVSAKPAPGYSFWSHNDTMNWLAETYDTDFCPEKISGPESDTRVHLEVGQEGVAREGMLFSTTMAAFERYSFRTNPPSETRNEAWGLLCRVSIQDPAEISYSPGLFGGENRVAVTERADAWPECPRALRSRLADAMHVRMVLATPALFEHGWKPAWIDRTSRKGSPPGLDGVQLELVSAAVPRRVAVSGWDLTNNDRPKAVSGWDLTNNGRPKPVRYAAPAGSVYFFNVLEGSNPEVLAKQGWLASISDTESSATTGDVINNNRHDGFGMALWGTWSPKEQE